MAEIARWLLNDGPGNQPTTAVDSVGSHNGTYTFGGTRGEMRAGGLAPWYLNLAANATGGYVGSVLNDVDFHLLGVMTVMGWWLKAPTEAFEDTVICAVESATDTGDADNILWSFRLMSTGIIRLRWESVHNTFRDASSPSGQLNASMWQHFAAVRYVVTGSNLGVRFYKNAVLVGTDDNGGAGYAPPTGGANSKFRINRYGASSPSHNQGVCGVRVYNSEEPIGTIQSVYNAEKLLIDGGVTDKIWTSTKHIIQYENVGRLYDPRYMGRRTNRVNAGFHRTGNGGPS